MVEGSADRGWIVKAVSCGGCAVVGIWLLSVLMAAVFGPLRAIGQSVGCQGNLFRVTRAFRMYADDYDDRLPTAVRWMDRVTVYSDRESRLHCPSVSRAGEPVYGYAMNDRLDGKARSKVADPETTPVVYDSTNLARSAHDSVATLPTPGRHQARQERGQPMKRGNFVGYLSGSARIKLDAPAPPKG